MLMPLTYVRSGNRWIFSDGSTIPAVAGGDGDPPPPPPPPPDPPPPPPDDDKKDWKAEAEKWQSLSRKHEERAKANAEAAKERDELRRKGMSDQEKAVDEARAEVRTSTLREVGGRLAKAEIRAAAAGRMAPAQLDALLDGVDVVAFLTDDGEVAADKVKKFIDGIAPPADPNAPPPVPDLGQGPRTNTKADPGPGMGRLRHAYANPPTK